MSHNSSTAKYLSIAGGIAGTALVVWPLAVWLEVRRCERPSYNQLLTLGKELRSFYDRALAIDVREYDPYIIAEVTVEGKDMREATGKGFEQIAGYIFGGNVKQGSIPMTSPVQTEEAKDENEKNEKIAMTAPVTTEMMGGKYKIAFVMPSKYKTKDDLPKPKNAAVQLTNVPSHYLGAISWRGYPGPSEKVIKEKESQLRAALAEAGIEVEENAPTKVYQYWPPFAPGPIKQYDVLLPVKKESIPSSDGKTKNA